MSAAMIIRLVVGWFVALGLVLAALVVDAQQQGKVFRIGILGNLPQSTDGGRVWGAFTGGLRDLGYVEGRNVEIVWRSTDGKYERLPDLAAELVRLKVDVIVAPATQNVAVARQATQTIPIVMAGVGDPVGAGLVSSLARPGGNVTGTSTLALDIAGKQLALLKEMVPGVSHMAVLGNPANQAYPQYLEALKSAARSVGLRLHLTEARGPDDFDQAFAAMTRERVAALVVMPDGMLLLHKERIVSLAARHRLATMYSTTEFMRAGGLVAYSPSMPDSFRRAATFVDKIFKGAKPGELPVEQPTKFDMIINLKTAKALGLSIPPSMLARADEVIQ
jgi:putative tryptophan/tyrosine transport system substrate-binding protein